MTGLVHDRNDAKKIIEELKSAGFSDRSILLAMKDEVEQARLLNEARVQLVAEQEIPSLPDLSSGEVLIMVDAEERAENALNILNRNKALTGGVRISAP